MEIEMRKRGEQRSYKKKKKKKTEQENFAGVDVKVNISQSTHHSDFNVNHCL